ncbi:MAG: hypothetical protein ACM3XZ_07040 [Betaproteobacteria bacterium]
MIMNRSRYLDKLAVSFLCLALILGGALPVGAWEIASGPLAGLASLERATYGQEGAGSILQRLEQLETDILGGKQEGAIIARLERLNTVLRGPGESLYFRLSALEWYLTRTVSREPLAVRLAQMEQLMSGQAGSGPLGPRLAQLAALAWPDGRAGGGPVQLEKGTPIKIKLGTELNSQTSKVGDKVKFQVAQDVKVEGKLIFPAGTPGEGRVTEVISAGNLGRDGRVLVDFGTLVAIDGQALPVAVDEQATEMNKSLQFAAGASMAGVLLLGPVGLVGGYFVRGKDVVIPIGTEFFVSLSASAAATGLSVNGLR